MGIALSSSFSSCSSSLSFSFCWLLLLPVFFLLFVSEAEDGGESDVEVSACKRARVVVKRQDLCVRAAQGGDDGQARRRRGFEGAFSL